MKKVKKQVVVHLERSDLQINYQKSNLENIRRERFLPEAQVAICGAHVAIFRDGEKTLLIKG